jgi:hypothetical protein
MRGSLIGDIPIGPCEAVGCAAELCRGDRFVAYLNDRIMCLGCHESGAPLKPQAVAAPKQRIAGTRAKRGGRDRKRVMLHAMRIARREQITAQLREDETYNHRG